VLKKTPKKNTTETQEKYSDPHSALCKILRVQKGLNKSLPLSYIDVVEAGLAGNVIQQQ